MSTMLPLFFEKDYTEIIESVFVFQNKVDQTNPLLTTLNKVQ